MTLTVGGVEGGGVAVVHKGWERSCHYMYMEITVCACVRACAHVCVWLVAFVCVHTCAHVFGWLGV